MDNLGAVICYPQFRHWEVNDSRYTVPLNVAQAQATPTTVVIEGLHQVAFRLVLSGATPVLSDYGFVLQECSV